MFWLHVVELSGLGESKVLREFAGRKGGSSNKSSLADYEDDPNNTFMTAELHPS